MCRKICSAATPFLLGGLFVLTAINGACRPTNVSSDGSEAIKISDKSGSHDPGSEKGGGAPNEASDRLTNRLKKYLGETESISDPTERDRRYKEFVQQLIFESRFVDAADISLRIKADEMRNSLLEDIARLQINDAMQAYEMVSQAADEDAMVQGGLLAAVLRAVQTTRLMDDPARQAESFGNIALFRQRMKDEKGASEMMDESVEAIHKMPKNDSGRARGLLFYARWFLRKGWNDKTYELCREIESSLSLIDSPFDAACFGLELSSVYTLLGKDRNARDVAEKVEPIIRKIKEPREEATVLLRLAETKLFLKIRDKNISPAESLLSTKTLVMEAAALAGARDRKKSNPMAKEISLEPKTPENVSNIRNESFRLDWKAIETLKNKTLQKIAVMQAWSSPLEDTWETVQDIDDDSIRDDALVSVIEMLVATGQHDDAEAWADEVTDKTKLEKEWITNSE